MRKVLVLLLLLLPMAAFCKDKKKHKVIKLPVSRWREVKRMGFDSSIISFQDTFFVTFLKKDSFSYHNLNGFVYNGGYTINEDSLLDFGTARFKIAVKRPNMLVLEDDKARYVLGPNSDSIVIIKLDTGEKALPVTNIDQMIGHWTVYKRQAKDQQMGAIDAATSITAAYITGPSTDGKLGYIYGGQDAKNNPSWYIKSFGIDQVLECDGKGLRVLKVNKCQKGELILEESDVSYYFKQFK